MEKQKHKNRNLDGKAKKCRNRLACEFTAHYAGKNAEMNLNTTTTNGFNFRIIIIRNNN